MIYLIIFLRKIKYFFGKSQCDCSAENKKENYYKIAISTRKLFYTVRFLFIFLSKSQVQVIKLYSKDKYKINYYALITMH